MKASTASSQYFFLSGSVPTRRKTSFGFEPSVPPESSKGTNSSVPLFPHPAIPKKAISTAIALLITVLLRFIFSILSLAKNYN